MGIISNAKRIIREDYPADYGELVDKLAYTLNPFLEQVVSTINGNIDFNNLTQKTKTVDVTVDATGKVLTGGQLVVTTNSTVIGIQCIRARNLTSSTTYPTSTPFVSFTPNGNIINIQHISGLQEKMTYRLTLVFVT